MKKQYAISFKSKETYNSYFFNIIQVPTGYKLLFF